jgi:hypothetical protein
MTQRTMPQVPMGHQRGIDTLQVAGDTGFTAEVTLVLRNGRKRWSSVPKRPEEPDEHESTADQENDPKNPPTGSFTRH